IIIIQSDTSSDETPSSDDTSSDGPSSDETYYDDSTKKPKTTARKGPTKELLKWYDDTTDESIAKIKFAAKSKDSRLESRKSTMDISFTLGSAKEVDNLRILDDIGSREYTIYEMMKGYFVWTVRYLVSTDEFMTLFPKIWSIQFTVWSLGLGEREEEYFLVISLSGKVVKYNLISKTMNEIFNIGSNQMDDDDEFIPPYVVHHNLYEFILSFAKIHDVAMRPEKWERLERGRLGTHGDENGEGGEERAMTRGSTRGVVWSARICGFASVRTEKEAEIVLDLSVI
ncbi:hypothetical protein Tco_1005876, partial [Tanacetum coccineum]